MEEFDRDEVTVKLIRSIYHFELRFASLKPILSYLTVL